MTTSLTDTQASMALLRGYSLEITAKELSAAHDIAAALPPSTLMMVPHLAKIPDQSRLAAACAIRQLGLSPVPHFSARRIDSEESCARFLAQLVAEAGVDHCFVVAGDPAVPAGPFADSATLIGTGLFERAGIKVLGVAGYPEGHKHMAPAEAWHVLEAKCRDIAARGMQPEIVTQFCFDAPTILTWLVALRTRGIDCPVRLGIPGPATIASLLRFAASCGVGASASVLAHYGISASKLLSSAGPNRLVDDLAEGLGDAHGRVSLHFHPFGGLARLIDWLEQYR
ncbi:methylenetetrahydrofolate reductase [Asaia siamensis]